MRFGLLTTLLGLALAPAALAPAAPVPRDAGPRYFYPTRTGDRMAHVRDDGYEGTTTVANVKKVDGALHVTLNQIFADGTERLDETMEVSSKGVRMLKTAYRDRPLPNPFWAIKSTPDADAAWSNRWPVGYNGGIVFQEQDLTAKGWETVEVPAGKFQAVRVEQTAMLLNEKSQCTRWYALDVGCVKWKDATSGSVLKSFTRGPN